MACDDELLITYGLGYVFEKSKLLIISEIEEKTVLKYEMNIMEEISSINKLNEKFKIKCDLKSPKDYVSNIEDALEEKLFKTIPMITSIKAKNMDKQVHLMEEYAKVDLSQLRLRKEGYIQKDSNLIKQYLDNCAENLEIGIGIKEKKSSRYNKMILKIILTSSFGNEFGHFLTKQGQAIRTGNDEKLIEEQLKNNIKNNFLVKKKYNELDFLNFILFLEEWQKKHFSWDQNYTNLMLSIDRKGDTYKEEKSELKDSVISFIKEKRYLYFPYGRYNEENMLITLDDEMYMKRNNKEKDIHLYNSHTILEKKEKNLYEIILRNYEEIDLEYNKEIGYLLLYNNDEVFISVVIYDEKNEKIEYVNKYKKFNSKMLEILEKHFIL